MPKLIKIQPGATVCSLIYFTAKSLYVFRVSTAPIIRSTKNCNCSLRYMSYSEIQGLTGINQQSCVSLLNSNSNGLNFFPDLFMRITRHCCTFLTTQAR